MIPARILFLITSLGAGGAEGQLIKLIRLLDRKRFEPHVVLLAGDDPTKIAMLDCPVTVVNVAQGGYSRNPALVFSALVAVWRFTKIVRAFDPDIVHAFLPASTVIAGLALRLMGSRAKLIVGRRALVGSYRKKRSVGAFLERKITQRWADLAIGNSQRVTDELIEIDGVGSDRAVTIHNGVETFGGSRLDVASEPVIFSSVANFRKLKGHDIFVRAAEKIAKVRPECLFGLLGQDQGTEAETRRALEASPIRHWKIHGPASSPQDVYANSSVLLYTSMSEGFSNVILEAMASGLPVIAADVGGNREAIVDGETGFLVPAGSVDAFVEKALRLANEPQLRRRMGEAGRVRAQTMFSIGAMVEAYEKVYADTLSNESRVAECASGNIQSI